uniref:DUF38 domain-containing protein n=1 Tax=Panagrolaimus superbus TaxID=310955 RepID=A0A914YSR7_9BILA
MPKIIEEVLREVFLELLGNDLENAKHIEKFMLSGKEAFEVAINFFSTAKRVTIIKNDFLILFPSGHHHVMLYDCVVLKPILNAIAESLELLEFRKRPIGSGENVVYDTLIREGLKNIYFYAGHEVPANYMEKIRNLKSLENVAFEGDLSISDLSFMRPSPNSKIAVCANFADIISQNFDNVCYPGVESLEIKGNFHCSIETVEFIPDFITKIFKIFPNLENFNVLYANLLEPPTGVRLYFSYKPQDSWQNILATMKRINLEMFANLPKNVKGSFHFQCIGNNNESVNIADKIVDKEEYRFAPNFIEKHFFINENMEFKFSTMFYSADSSDESDGSSDADETDSDESDSEMETD